ncbi:hypothetical protein EAG14_03305 [Acidovorax sp. 1608163]|nr:hypothetical protein EAG14_03305 [Acidovorax sp. 1608163]
MGQFPAWWAGGSYQVAFENTKPFTLSLSKRRAGLRQAQPERVPVIERELDQSRRVSPMTPLRSRKLPQGCSSPVTTMA